MRSSIILSEVFDCAFTFFGDKKINALETGTSFSWEPQNVNNLSTPNIYKAICNYGGGALNSVDNDKERLQACQRRMNPLLDSSVSLNFVVDDSVIFMQQQINIGNKFNLFWLDSCESAKHGLEEYELSLKLFDPHSRCIVCIDDFGATGSVKWRLSSDRLIKESDRYEVIETATGLLVGYYNNGVNT